MYDVSILICRIDDHLVWFCDCECLPADVKTETSKRSYVYRTGAFTTLFDPCAVACFVWWFCTIHIWSIRDKKYPYAAIKYLLVIVAWLFIQILDCKYLQKRSDRLCDRSGQVGFISYLLIIVCKYSIMCPNMNDMADSYFPHTEPCLF